MKPKLKETELACAFEEAIRYGRVCTDQYEYPRFSHIAKEMDCQKGRPDFVASSHDMTAQTSLAALLAEVLTTRSLAHILSLLSATTWRSKEYILGSAGLSPPLVRKSLRRLEELGLALENDADEYALAPTLAHVDLELWAFELKLHDWKRALYQALQYQAFAHFSVVVIAEQWAHRAERQVDAFRSFNIGIIALEADTRHMRIILHPQRSTPRSRFHYYYALGKFLRSLEEDTDAYSGRAKQPLPCMA